ncbi:hypothetical protein [Altericroceibacterium spongiae]|uniref:hypothetical protein n=1 Tax=Altericroceibacterium spongiae TaxID=2320269 RepID=UPI0015FF1262|nr:hypothetical protein [Altericroceibacterium spongiae]
MVAFPVCHPVDPDNETAGRKAADHNDIATVISTSFVGGAHFGILSIAGVYYATAIRANGAGWATSVAKIGGIAGPIIGGYVLTSGLPIVRSFAILAICPLTLALCALGIAHFVRKRPDTTPPLPDPVPAS